MFSVVRAQGSMVCVGALTNAQKNESTSAREIKDLFADGIEDEAKFNKAFMKEFIAKDKELGNRIRNNPAETWLELKTDAEAELAKGQDDFSYAPHRFVLERFVRDFELRKHRKFGQKYAEQLDQLRDEALALLNFYPNGNPPYWRTHRFILKKVEPLYDLILGERHPHLLANEYHRSHADPKLEETLAAAPNLLMSYSFILWADSMFIYSRPAPHEILGINLKGLDDRVETPYADNWPMKISEFTYHDLGHVLFKALKNILYIQSSGKDLTRVVFEWQVTRDRIKLIADQVRNRDANLGDAIERLLMEMMHERGVNFSLSLLKQELETNKWLEIIERKRRAHFYDHFGTNEREFDRLAEAKDLLLKAVERLKSQDQMAWLQTTKGVYPEIATKVPVQISYNKPLSYGHADLEVIEILNSKSVQFSTSNTVEQLESLLKPIPIIEFVTAQVAVASRSPFRHSVRKKMAKILWAIENRKSVKIEGEKMRVASILISPDQTISVKLEDGRIVPLRKVSVSVPAKAKLVELSDQQEFEINQLLGASERGEKIAFTIREPEVIYTGWVDVEEDRVTGLYTAKVKPIGDKGEYSYPLADLRIDPIPQRRQ